jgi:hypothetical protein
VVQNVSESVIHVLFSVKGNAIEQRGLAVMLYACVQAVLHTFQEHILIRLCDCFLPNSEQFIYHPAICYTALATECYKPHAKEKIRQHTRPLGVLNLSEVFDEECVK